MEEIDDEVMELKNDVESHGVAYISTVVVVGLMVAGALILIFLNFARLMELFGKAGSGLPSNLVGIRRNLQEFIKIRKMSVGETEGPQNPTYCYPPVNPHFYPGPPHMKDLSFYNSHHAKTLQEKFNVRFSLHESYHAQFTGRVEKVVGIVKRSFTSFKQAKLNYHHMSCLLFSIARTINDRPISLFRAQTLNSPLNVVTPRALMFCYSKPVNKFYLMRTNFDAKIGDSSYIMTLLK